MEYQEACMEYQEAFKELQRVSSRTGETIIFEKLPPETVGKIT